MKKRVSNIVEKNKILIFLAVMLLTIFLTRFTIYYIIDPNPKIAGWELHHFDYGLILLIATSLLMLFGKMRKPLYIILTAIALGWIIDELWFIKLSLGHGNPAFYNPSLIYVTILAVAISITSFLISLPKKGKK